MTGTSDQIDTALATIRDSVARIGEAGDIRSHTRAVASMLSAVRHLGRSASGLPSAKSAILDYLLSHVGQTVTGGELEAVSGISEYARRVRDLRAEGWRIVGGATAPSVRERSAMRRLGIEPGSTDYALLSATRKRCHAQAAALQQAA
jgi:hypothetical protein